MVIPITKNLYMSYSGRESLQFAQSSSKVENAKYSVYCFEFKKYPVAITGIRIYLYFIIKHSKEVKKLNTQHFKFICSYPTEESIFILKGGDKNES